MKWLDLFSGIGMYALGLEQAGHEVIGFCEVDKFCHKILKKHWPTKPISWSIQSLNVALMGLSAASHARTSAEAIDVRGGGTGLAGQRSGLFWDMVRTVGMVRPRYWLLENVAALFQRERQSDMGAVLGAVASLGYNIEWDCVGAGTVGAPHHRARAYILANPRGARGERQFPHKIQRQPEFSWCENVRRLEDLRERPDLYPPQLCGGGIRVTERLHAIGNGNPPCVIRELTRNLK